MEKHRQPSKQVIRIHLVSNSQLMADKLGHLCGTCKSFSSKDTRVGGRCCYGCANASGHFGVGTSYGEITEEELKELKIKYDFDPNTDTKNGKGFLTPTGCALPRELRSTTCLQFMCNDWSQEIKKDPQLNRQHKRFQDHIFSYRLGYNYDEDSNEIYSTDVRNEQLVGQSISGERGKPGSNQGGECTEGSGQQSD